MLLTIDLSHEEDHEIEATSFEFEDWGGSRKVIHIIEREEEASQTMSTDVKDEMTGIPCRGKESGDSKQKFYRMRRDGLKTIMVERKTNQRGRFIGVSKLLKTGRSRRIIFSGGRKC